MVSNQLKFSGIFFLLALSGVAQQVDYNTQIKNKPSLQVTDSPYFAKGDGTTNDTTAINNAITAATTLGKCVYFPPGNYKVTYSGGFSSIPMSENACMVGSSDRTSIITQYTNGASTIGVMGSRVSILNMYITKAAGITGGIGISIYPDVTSSTQAAYTRIWDSSIYAAFCAIGDSACETAADSNRLSYAILVQSGTKDSVFNWIRNVKIRWANQGVELISGGLSGSAGPGAAQATWIDSSYISSVSSCVALVSSGENYVRDLQCTAADHSQFLLAPNTSGNYNGFQSSGNTMSVFGEASAALIDFKNTGDYAAGHCSQGNIVTIAQNQISSGSTGNVHVLGSCQDMNEVHVSGSMRSGFYYNAGDPTKSADSYLATGPLEDYTTGGGPTATIDFRSTPNIQNIFRYRSFGNIATTSDFVNWNPFSGGYTFRVDSTYDITKPLAIFDHPNASANELAYLRLQTGPLTGPVLKGGIGSRYYNSATSAVTTSTLIAYNAAGTQTFPIWARGDGVVGMGIEMTVSTLAGIGCSATLPPTGTLQQEIGISDLLTPTIGAVPVGGGAVHGKVHCNGSIWTVSAENTGYTGTITVRNAAGSGTSAITVVNGSITAYAP